MRAPLFLCVMLLACLASHGARAQASAEIHRCISSSGGQVFTDRSCADMQATPALPGREDTDDAPAWAGPAPQLCAADLPELKQQIVDAFAVRNANRLAGLMLWDGYSKHSAVGEIRSLSALMRHPLLDITESGGGRTVRAGSPVDLYDASQPLTTLLAGSSHGTGTPTAPDELTVVTEADDGSGGSRDTGFALERQSGCLWLRARD